MNPWEASVPEWITAATSFLALIGLLFVWRQLRLQERQLVRDLENDYVQRYWQIRDNIDASTPGDQAERRWRLAYMRLCEDQIDLRVGDDRVTDDTWSQWDAAMKSELKRHAIYRELLLEVPSDELTGVRALLTIE